MGRSFAEKHDYGPHVARPLHLGLVVVEGVQIPLHRLFVEFELIRGDVGQVVFPRVGAEKDQLWSMTHILLLCFFLLILSVIPSTHLPVFLSPWSQGFMRR